MTQSITHAPGTNRWFSALCKISLGSAAIIPFFIAGCSMCCATHDFEYPMFQSNYARTDPEHGRVGSLFTDPNIGMGVRPLTNADVPDESGGKQNELPESDGPVDPNFEEDPLDGLKPEAQQDTNTKFQFPARR